MNRSARTLPSALACLLLFGCAQPVISGFDGQRVQAATEQQNANGSRVAPAERTKLRIGAIRGPSNAVARRLRSTLARELRARGFDVVRRRGEGILELTGMLAALNEGSVTSYTYEWRLTDARGVVARPVVGIERSQGSSSDLWNGVNGAAVARMSARVARGLALSLRTPN